VTTTPDSTVVPFAAVWRKIGTAVGGIPVEVHVAGSDEQAASMLGRYLELLSTVTHPGSDPLLRLACAADAYLMEINTTLSRHGSSKLERRLPRLAFALGTTIERLNGGSNFEVEPTVLPQNALVVVVQHGHTVCMTTVRGPMGDAIAVTGSRAALCVVAGQRLRDQPGDLADLSRYFGISGMVIARAPSALPVR
jgi:hypothetical protein